VSNGKTIRQPRASLADFFPAGEAASSDRAVGEGLKSSRSVDRVAAVVSAVSSPPLTKTISWPRFRTRAEGEAGFSAAVGGPLPRWAGQGRAVSAMQRAYEDRIRSRLFDQRTLSHLPGSFATAAPAPSISPCAALSFLPASSMSLVQRRSFV
jgi:hypothetical protein